MDIKTDIEADTPAKAPIIDSGKVSGHREAQSYRQGVFFSFVRYGILMTSGFVYSLVYAKLLGSETVGTVALLTGVLGIFKPISSLGEFFALVPGLNRYSPDDSRASSLFWATTILSMTVTSLLCIPYSILAGLLLANVYGRPDLFLPLAVYLIGFYLLGNLTYFLSSPFQAYQQMRFLAKVELINGVVKIGLLVTMIQLLGVSTMVAIWTQIGAFLLNVILLIWMLPKVFRVWPRSISLVSLQEDLRGVYRYSMKAWAGNASISLFQHADRLVLGYYAHPAILGIYAVTYGIFEKVLMMGTNYENMVFASAAKLSVTQEHEVIYTIYASAIRTSFFMLTPLVVLLSGFGETLLQFYGHEYVPGTFALSVLLLGVLFDNFSRITLGLMGGVGSPGQKAMVMMVGGGINLVLNLTLIPMFLLAGAAWANTLCYMATAILSTVWLIRKAPHFHALALPLIRDMALVFLLNALMYVWVLRIQNPLALENLPMVAGLGVMLLLYAWIGRRWVFRPR